MLYQRRFHFLQRLLLLALPLAFCLILFFPAVSEAHAILLRSEPTRDAQLTSAPTQVRMWFSENVNPTFSTATVVNASNTRVDKNDAHVLSNDAKEMDISLKANLPPAVYVVIWRTQSADDGHILSGSFLFYVLQADRTRPSINGNTLPGQDVRGDTSASSATGQLDGPAWFSFIMITLIELGVVFWVGAQLWRSFVLQISASEAGEQQGLDRSVERRFERFFSLPVLFVLLLANVGMLMGQGLVLTGGRLDQVFPLLGGLLNGHFGTYWILREVIIGLASLLAAYSLWVHRTPLVDEIISWGNLLLGLGLLIAMTLSGHAAATSGNILIYAVLLDWLHLLAASLWVGGMMYLSTVYLPVLQGVASVAERSRRLLTVLPRFSSLAIVGVIVMAITGPFNAVVHMTSLDQLFSTAYGRALTVKTLLVIALLVTSAIHVLLLRPRMARTFKLYTTSSATTVVQESVEDIVEVPVPPLIALEAKQIETRMATQYKQLTSILRWEPLLGIAVLVCVGLMNVFAGTLQPAIANPGPLVQATPTVVSKPFHTTVQTTDNKYTLEFDVSPNHFGTNVFTARVLDSNGAQDTNVGVSLYLTMLDMDMGTDALNLQPDGKGKFSAQGDFNMGGNWQVRLQVRATDHTTHEATVKLVTPF